MNLYDKWMQFVTSGTSDNQESTRKGAFSSAEICATNSVFDVSDSFLGRASS